MTTPLYIGLMSGTSVDAIDAVIARFERRTEIIAHREFPIPDPLRKKIFALSDQTSDSLTESLALDRAIGFAFAESALALLAGANLSPSNILAIGSHGQTIRHQPETERPPELRYTLQLGDPNTIAEQTGIQVVADFRRRDIAADGQGAPLVPPFHASALAQPNETLAVVNIGGMSNITLIRDQSVLAGFDSGPGNALLDYWHQQFSPTKGAYDTDGAWSGSGRILPELLQTWLAHPYFQLPAPKSTGRELFQPSWLCTANHLHQHSAQDVQCTLVELTARSISDALQAQKHAPDTVLVCGGGAYNAYLMQRLQTLINCPVKTTAARGLAPNLVEATAFAWLAHQRINHLPGNCPSSTGSRGARVLGGLFAP